MRFLYFIIISLTVITLSSCRKDFTTSLSTGDLSFSQDTIFFNRVFDDISSSTRKFTVKNNSDKDITVPHIGLERGNDSFYRLNVDGMDGKSFENVRILAKDSIFVFSEVTVDFDQVTDVDFMYRDKVLFDSGSNEQEVALESLVLDVHLIRPNRTQIEDGFNYEEIVLQTADNPEDIVYIRGTNLTENTTWTNDKPYLIYNYVGISEGKTLTIEAGTRLYFHQNSGILVQDGGKLLVNGELSTTEELENQVIFQGDRLEENYSAIPGQWGTIWLMNGSSETEINYATIKNATIGLFVDSENATQTLTLHNSEIYNTSSFGLFARNAKITAKNSVISNNAESSLAIFLGGTYDFTHCTIANYWNSSSRQSPALSINDSFETATALFVANLDVDFTNCIIDGNQNIEFTLNNIDNDTFFNFNFKNCLLKFNDISNDFEDDVLYDFDNTDTGFYTNNLFNKNPNFLNTNNSDEYFINLIIGDDSFANNQADISVLSNIILQKDILGVNRTNGNSDIGAYQHITFPED